MEWLNLSLTHSSPTLYTYVLGFSFSHCLSLYSAHTLVVSLNTKILKCPNNTSSKIPENVSLDWSMIKKDWDSDPQIALIYSIQSGPVQYRQRPGAEELHLCLEKSNNHHEKNLLHCLQCISDLLRYISQSTSFPYLCLALNLVKFSLTHMRENTLTNTSNMVMFSEEIPGQHPALEGCSNSAVSLKL